MGPRNLDQLHLIYINLAGFNKACSAIVTDKCNTILTDFQYVGLQSDQSGSVSYKKISASFVLTALDS